MRPNPTTLLAALLFAGTCFAQERSSFTIALRSGNFIPEKDISAERVAKFNQAAARSGIPKYVLIQFDELPGESVRHALDGAGIQLLEYVPENAYTATIKGNINNELLARTKVRALIELKPEQKMSPQLLAGNYPLSALRMPGKLELWISYPQTITEQEVAKELTALGMEIIPTPYSRYRIMSVRIPGERLNELAGLSYIDYVQSAPGTDVELNNKSRVLSRANVLQSAAVGGRNLRGEGVTIGIGDNGSLLQHLDFTGRLIDRAGNTGGSHGTHVGGIAAGAGLIQEKYAGYLPKATIIGQTFSGILSYSPAYVQDHGMVITNNSYGNVVDDCTTFGVYDLYSRVMDEMAFLLPELQNVFAAGNSGAYACASYPATYKTVLGAYQSAKNVISVGSETELGVLHSSSSRGPVADGRIKPEIVAQGVSVVSTYPVNIYGLNTGTSMASPAVAGGLGLLYQRYRQLHANANPSNALMKALLCNGATDIGNPGPDYFYGFGQMDLLRSVTMLENNNYFQSSVNQGSTQTHTVSIPAGSNIAQLKVMLYWNDAAAAMLSSKTLVNDLDLEVSTPSGTTVLPLVLDTIPSNVGNNATQKADHINNIEQVVINNPTAGSYTFTVKGTTIPAGGGYNYFLVYDTLPVSSTLTYPMGGEHFSAGDSIYINWESYGNPSNSFTLQYSNDGGATWPVTIASDVPANQRQYKWFVPAGATSQARVRLTRNGTELQSASNNFVVLGTPVVSLSSVQCEGYIAVNWTAIADATDYEVMMLRGDEMVSVAVTEATSCTISGLSKDSAYWVAVRARINGNPGWRSAAITRQPNTGTCTGSISNNDLKIDAIISPDKSGRRFTSATLSSTVNIKITIKNLDDAPTTGNIPVSYIIGTSPAVSETIINPAIAARGTYTYTFTTTANMSAVGSYPLTVTVSYPGDPVTANDTLTKVYKQLDNPALDLATDLVDNMEGAPVQSYTSAQTGLTGLDRYDFKGSGIYGRIRTFVNSGIAYSGNRAITLDAARYTPGGTIDSLTATFNLQSYDAATDDIRLDFQFKQHGQAQHAANKVWIRGSDTGPWIEAYDLFANQGAPGVFKQSSSIELRSLLIANSQNFSSSTQVRWGQWGEMLTADNESAAGYTFDDVHLYRVNDDIRMVMVDTPVVASCGLNGNVPVKVIVKNSAAATVNNIPVRMQVDGGVVISETIPSIPGNTTITYSFSATANMASPGRHTLKTWVAYASDSYKQNDTATIDLINSPIIASFPYLQNFETDDGYWYAAGTRSTWQYGTPVSPRISKAASGTKAWKTSLYGNYNDGELSYLYSPCFDISGMTNPTLSLSLALDLEDCGSTLCDGAYVEYSADGQSWTRLGAAGQGTNWYNKNYGGSQLWNVQNYTRWHVATIPLPTGLKRLRIRFVMRADPYTSREGIAVDDIHIYDKQFDIFDGTPSSNPVTQPAVNGNNWLHFTDAGSVIASINPAGQDLGSTVARTYINTAAIRNAYNQYYHNRNITIKPTQTALSDSAVVRFYFTDQETEQLLNATGCDLCSKPVSAYELGVSKYTDPDKTLENGSLTDDINGSWYFIRNAAKVPYGKGYYAEFRVKGFSEFWLNNEVPDKNMVSSIELTGFTATKINTDVRLDWTTASEINSSYYDIELAKGNTAASQQAFAPIARVSSENRPIGSTYTFTDKENNKTGVRYYRLKMVDINGDFNYSEVRPVVFDEEMSWQLYPNPSKGIFNLICQAPVGERIDIRIHDINGRQVGRAQQQATGFVQKIPVDLSPAHFAQGVYLLEVSAGKSKSSFRMVKL